LRPPTPNTRTLDFSHNAIADSSIFTWTYINNNIKNLFLAGKKLIELHLANIKKKKQAASSKLNKTRAVYSK
jgi:hypothetical protein